MEYIVIQKHVDCIILEGTETKLLHVQSRCLNDCISHAFCLLAVLITVRECICGDTDGHCWGACASEAAEAIGSFVR